MRTNDEKVRLKIRLDDAEKAKLEHEAALCGLTKSEYLRQLCLGRQPRPKSRRSSGSCWTPCMKSTPNWSG